MGEKRHYFRFYVANFMCVVVVTKSIFNYSFLSFRLFSIISFNFLFPPNYFHQLQKKEKQNYDY